MFPDGMGELEEELHRYQMLGFRSRINFRPPYFYNRARGRSRPSCRARLLLEAKSAPADWGPPVAGAEPYIRPLRILQLPFKQERSPRALTSTGQ